MQRLPPLRLLVTFEAVRRLGSMRLAAAELNVTRPAVSQAIKSLEAWVGVPLFDRTTKPSVATEAGERLARVTRASLGQIGEVVDEIRLSAGADDRQITVSCTIGMATYWLMPRLSAFYGRFPDAMVSVQAPPSDMPAFSAGIDVALRYGPAPWDDGETVKVFEERAFPAGQPRRMAALGSDLAVLRTVPLIEVRTPHGNHWAGWRDYFAAKRIDPPTGPRQTFDNYVQATQAALDGHGIMLGWRSINDALLSEGRLASLADGVHDFGTTYWATSARRRSSNPFVRGFLEWVGEAGAAFERTVHDQAPARTPAPDAPRPGPSRGRTS
ncbi:LysR substrate-binding domain-containing protein [Lutibaculum baratangense]|uniref:Transcriptional regulator, LysR family protein n=1 Tax=Lutibaculum baratangense AMV1 TaxID=631454 RepID=V4RFC4_9HYPH|nr:LysR substrate-binding domain-containing protein [Lutibaculum baratangense]ESR24074.1 transcriptional regulator, LysR family protein [Lutibaculum baratangense AMV1]